MVWVFKRLLTSYLQLSLGAVLGRRICVYSITASLSNSNISFPSIPGVESATTCWSSLSGVPLPPVDHPSKAQSVFQHSVHLSHFSSLLDSCSVRDQARLHAISHHSCASAWLRAIPSEPLSLTLSEQEFVVALWYWLGIPLACQFHVSARCSCGVVLDGHGDYILGCGDGPLRIRRHDAICDLLWHPRL